MAPALGILDPDVLQIQTIRSKMFWCPDSSTPCHSESVKNFFILADPSIESNERRGHIFKKTSIRTRIIFHCGRGKNGVGRDIKQDQFQDT